MDIAPPTFTLCYTTVRAAHVASVIQLWQSRARYPHLVGWSVTTDRDRADVLDTFSKFSQDFPGLRMTLSAVQDLPGNCVKGWNLASETARVGGQLGDILIAVADDFVPPQDWDVKLAAASVPGWWLSDHVVHVWDGYNPDIFTLAILTATRYRKFCYLFYPGYESMFSDTEFTFVAAADGVVIEATNLLFEHMHPDCGKRQRDNTDLHHASKSRWAAGEMLFNYRKSIGFPVDEGPMADTTEVSPKDMAVYVQAIKDDFCLNEVCDRLVDEGARTFFFYIPNQYWSGQETRADEISQVEECARRLTQNPALTVHCKIFDIAKHRAPGRTRIQVETHARNEALEWIRAKGFQHVVVADGDELWRKGLMAQLVQLVNDIKPQCVYTGMVPTIGLPGYPIEGAMDYATIYVGRDTLFNECRSTFGTRYELSGYRIIHFTATRRTMDEIIQKSRDSGHYDDPNYDFEGWIKNILPNIREGMTNVHMYKPYNPWKRVRAWSKQEMQEIPSSLHPFLAAPVSTASPHISRNFTPAGVPKAN